MLTVILTVAGAAVGAAIGGGAGLVFGALIGALFGQQWSLRQRLNKMEQAESRIAALQSWGQAVQDWMKDTHAWMMKIAADTKPESSEPPAAAATPTQPASLAPPDPTTRASRLAGTGPEAETVEPAQALPEPESVPQAEPQVQPARETVGFDPGPAVRAHAPAAAAAETRAVTDALAGAMADASDAPSDAAASPAHADALAGAAADRRVADSGASAARPSTDPLTWVFNGIKRWVTTGNAPVKVGVLVSLIGVGLLLREAHRRGIIELTIEMRLAAAAVFGLVLLAVGWRLRRRRPTYGLSLQGGGIAVLYVTLYAAFAVYDVLPPALAASAVVVVTAGAGVLSVVQDSRPLAVLGIIGGFLAPVLTYSQPEDHVYVFGFFAVLNAAIVGVAWFKTWPEFNLLGFVFTFGLTFFWLSNRSDQDEWIGTQPFIALFVLMYMSMPTLFAVREAPGLKRMWTGSSMFGSESGRGAWTGSPMLDSEFVRGAWTMPLVFGTPFIGLGLQQLAIGHIEYGLAVSAAVLAVAQGALAMVARRLGADRRELAEAGASLAVVFAAIAVPLALDAYFTATVWSLQGLVLVWFGCRRGRLLPIISGGVLQLLAAASFAIHLGESLPYPPDAPALVNEFFLGALLLAAAGLVSGWLLQRREHRADFDPAIDGTALAWGISWWIAAGLMEISYQLSSGRLSTSIVFTVVSLGGAALASRRLRWPHLNGLGLLVLPVMMVALLVSLNRQAHPLDRWGWAAWPLVLAVYYWFLRRREAALPQLSSALHVGGFWLLAVLVGVEVYWQVDRVADAVWPLVSPVAAVLALVGLTLAARRRPSWPVAAHWRSYLTACAGPALALIAVAVLLAILVLDGDPLPLPFVPLVNPVVLLAGVTGLGLWRWSRLAAAEDDVLAGGLGGGPRAAALAAVGTVTVSMETARAVHHWLEVRWEFVSLWESNTLQSSLSVIWAVIALSGMVAGVRVARRVVWVAGASWMAVVVAKLFLIDLSSLSAVGRVVSFIVVGILLLIVGYLAPVPPAVSDEPAGTGTARQEQSEER